MSTRSEVRAAERGGVELDRRKLLGLYIALVIVAGVGVWIYASSRWIMAFEPEPAYLMFSVFLLLTEAIRMEVRGKDDMDETNFSTTLAFAMLMMFGAPAAIASQGLATAVVDAFHRKPIWKTLFNIGQLSLSLAAAGLVLENAGVMGSGGEIALELGSLWAIVGAALAYFVTNLVLLDVALAISSEQKVFSFIVHDALYEAWATGALLLMAPLLVAVAQTALFLTPLIAVPLIGVYMQGRWAAQNRQLALFDPLTGLPNRFSFHRRLVAAVRNSDIPCAVLTFDLARFKEINDTLGHHHGDEVLREVGRRLAGLFDEEKTARLGADEFAVLLTDVRGLEDAEERAEQIVAALDAPFEIAGLRLDVWPTVGIALCPVHSDSPEVLMQYADIALHVAKEAHLPIAAFEERFDTHTPVQLAMVGELRRSVEDPAEFVLHYQPKISIETGEIVGVEVLSRWQHPTLGLLFPDSFIPLAERTGQIKGLTMNVLSAAMEQCARWRDEGLLLGVSVNLSPKDLLDSDVVDHVAELIDVFRLDPDLLTLEITESTLMTDPITTRQLLERLEDLGVRISIDDFGTGYSSLSYLTTLPVSEIKIDRSFVATMLRNETDLMVVQAIIDLGHNLGLRVVSEGVADAITHQRLIDLGCDEIQGYHIARPLPGDELEIWLDTARPARR